MLIVSHPLQPVLAQPHSEGHHLTRAGTILTWKWGQFMHSGELGTAEEDLSSFLDETTAEDEGDLPVTEGSKKIVMEPKDLTIFQYKRWFDNARLNLNPDWQRAYVWKGKRPSMLIESLLMQIPIPVIFLARTDTETYEVIDGVQRPPLSRCFSRRRPLWVAAFWLAWGA